VPERTRRHDDRTQFVGFRRSILIQQPLTYQHRYNDQLAPVSRFRGRLGPDLPRVADSRGFRAMPSRRDARGSQGAGLLFERGQRPAAGLDGGRGGSGRRRTRRQGIALALDDAPRVLTRAADRPKQNRESSRQRVATS
jgi:hypothetical protein